MSDFMQGNPDNSVAVPFSDDDKEKADSAAREIEEEESPNDTPEVRLTRKRKQQERISGLLREGKQSKEELTTLRAEQAATRAELAALRGYVTAQPRQQPANDGKDPYEQRLDQIYERQSEAYNAAQAEIKSGAFTAERQAYYERIARDIESAKQTVHTERVVDSRAHSMRAEQAQQVWVHKYPEVYNNPQAFEFAKATHARRRALGEAISNETVDEIMNETMTTFRLGSKRAPSPNERSRMSGLPSSGSGGSSRGSGIVMTAAFKGMAHAAYPDMPEADAEKKWVNSTGKRLREKKVL